MGEGLPKNNQETEFKVLDINVQKLTEGLSAIGAIRVFSGLIRDTYFDNKDKAFGTLGYRFRIREFFCPEANHESKKTYEVTLKGPKTEIKGAVSRLEIGATAESYDEAKETLVRLLQESVAPKFRQELVTTYFIQKERSSYTLDGIRFDIDSYESEGENGIYRVLRPYVPPFVEIEVEDPKSVQRARFLVTSILERSINDATVGLSTRKVIERYLPSKE